MSDNLFNKSIFYWSALILAAVATPLTFAPYYFFWLMPLIFASLILLTKVRPQHAVRSAYLFGLIGYSCQFYWIHTALHDVSGLPDIYALPLTVLLPAFLALYPALCFRILKVFVLPRHLLIGVALPILWTLTEFTRERLFTGFGWGAIGYSQIADHSPLAGFAPVGGIHLVTLSTAFCGAWLALLISPKGRLKNIHASENIHTVSPQKTRLVALSGIVLLLIAGQTFRHINFTQPTGQKSTVALAQGNIEQSLKWSADQIMPTIQRYFDQVSQTHADIVILPETAIPVMLQDLPPNIIDQFASAAQKNGSALALGIAQYTADRQGYLNAVINLSGNNLQTQSIPYYAKNHLVPFGEYKPLPALTGPFYNLMNMPLADFQRGGIGQKPFVMKQQRVAFNICYEDGFGDELIASAKQSTLLANASNMAWYGRSNAMYQQLQQSQTRALELGRYLTRATNTGATAIITPQGSIAAMAKPDTATVLEGKIEGYQGETPYMKLGGSWPLIIVLSAIITALLFISRRNKAATD